MTRLASPCNPQDLEYLIEKCVDIEKADYAVVTGVQIHNWSKDLANDNFEFVAPTKVRGPLAAGRGLLAGGAGLGRSPAGCARPRGAAGAGSCGVRRRRGPPGCPWTLNPGF